MDLRLWSGLIVTLILFGFVGSQCSGNSSECPKSKNTCITNLKRHIQVEINTFLIYIAMAEHFSQKPINRFGFAKAFLEFGMQHREHASRLAEQLLIHMIVDDVDELVELNIPSKIAWTSGMEALKESVNAEKSVTASCHGTLDQCSTENYIFDYLNNISLPDQDRRRKELLHMIDTFQQMIDSNAETAEYEYDKLLVFEKYILISNKVIS